MSENVIFCYSSTGNCLDMAKNIAKGLGDTDIILMRSEPAVTDVRQAKRVGFVFPCCGGGLPGQVERWARQIQIAPGAYTFAVCQYAGYMGAGLSQLSEIIPLDYWRAMSRQCAYIPLLPNRMMIPPLSPDKAQKRSEQWAAEIARLAKQKVRRTKRPPRRRLNALERETVWPLIVKRNTQKFKVTDSCIGCGLCERLCPIGNIKLVDGKPAWGTDCYQCVSCLQYCPQEAISLGWITDRRKRYHNSNIQAKELTKNTIHID